MSLRRLLVLVLLIAGGVLVTPAAPAWACSCADLSAAESLDHADAAFVGVATSVGDPADPQWSDSPVAVRFTVESVLKGTVDAETTVSTDASEASCGYTFVAGHRYRVYVKSLRTSLCSGNDDLSRPSRAPVAVTSSPVTAVASAPDPVPVRSGPPPAVWWSLGAIVLTIAAGILVIRRRRPQ